MTTKIFEQSVVENPAVVGFMLMKNPNSFKVLSNPNKIIGPLKILAAKLRDVDRNKARSLLDLGDRLERAMNSANKDLADLRWITRPATRLNTIGAFSATVSRHPKYNDLVSFQRKLLEIGKLLVSIREKILEVSKKHSQKKFWQN